MAGRLRLDELVTHRMPLEKINEAFELMCAGKRFVESSHNNDHELLKTAVLGCFCLLPSCFKPFLLSSPTHFETQNSFR